MPETEVDRSTETSQASSSTLDQANRSERGDLASGPRDGAGSGGDDQKLEGGKSGAAQISAELGPNGEDSRKLSSPSETAQSAVEKPTSQDGGGSQVSKPEANQSVASKPEANQSVASKPEANPASKPEGKPPEAPSKAETPDPKTLTKDQITDIVRQSSSVDDLKLNLGLGPVTDKALGDYLMSKGFSPPGSMVQEPAPKYDGPSIGPDDHQTVPRTILVTNSDGSTTKVPMSGNPQTLDQIQEEADWRATIQMVGNLSSAMGGTGSAKSAGPETYRGEGTPGSGRRW